MEKQKKTGQARRQILAEAASATAKVMGRDIKALAKVQENFIRNYNKILPDIHKKYVAVAEKTAAFQKKALSSRYSSMKYGMGWDDGPICPPGHIFPPGQNVIPHLDPYIRPPGNIYPPTQIFLGRWVPVVDISNALRCGSEIITEDIDAQSSLTFDSQCVFGTENVHKPYMTLTGGTDGVDNHVETESWFVFNIDDDKLWQNPASSYLIKPTVLLNGYWVKENWGTCSGVPAGGGNLKMTLRIGLSQLGMEFASTEITVLDVQNGPHGAIGQMFNVPGYSSLTPFYLSQGIKPADGDVAVRISLIITANISGYGYYLIDMKSSPFVNFQVESVELSKWVPWWVPIRQLFM